MPLRLAGKRVSDFAAGLVTALANRPRPLTVVTTVPPIETDTASMTGSLLTRGTESMTAPQIANAIETLGGTIDSGAHWEATRGMTPLRRMLYLDSRVWLPDDLLVKADKMTMAHAIELRVPFLDHELMEHAWSLPDHLKIHNGVGKALLRKAAVGRVPRRDRGGRGAANRLN